ncbi:MAG: A/G-specific adenine glycosylase [Woeseiaceae bacterium]|nr:A/G-specific adenine glycosylase [Gammaproteobacteria bacterium]NNK24199.1 A/G-specific adenine glycosylase [Woeseiaceae bacterium]
MSTDFADRLLTWFDAHGRKDLPWQAPIDAYRVWVSEIMLQQTQVQTVVPYFERFIARFPDVIALADAAQDDVLQHWSGLGYYARARNLHRAAQIVRDEHSGVFPETLDEVLALPGIGRSTAGAILSISFGQRHAILDGNVKRVLARHGAIEGWPGTTSVAKKLWAIAERNTPDQRVADYTQAIMDLGATLCTRTKPACERCPVASDCQARNRVTVTLFPGRKPKKDKPLRETTMVLASFDGHVYLERRPEAGIWGGLWSLPEVNGTPVEDWCRENLAREPAAIESWDTLRHSFSHYDLDIRPIVVRVAAPLSKVADGDDATWHRLDNTLPGGIAAPVSRLIGQLKRVT